MCPVLRVVDGAPAQTRKNQIGVVSSSAGLATASGGQDGGLTGGAGRGINPVNPLTATVLASQQAVLDQSLKVAPEAGTRVRRSASQCGPFASPQVTPSVDALYASTLSALQLSQAQLVPAFEALTNVLTAVSVPTVNQNSTAFNETLANATAQFVESVDAMIGLYQPGQQGGFNPLRTVFDSFLLNMTNPASLSAKGVSAEANMTQFVNTWIAEQKEAFPGNEGAYNQLALAILQGRGGNPGVQGAFQGFTSSLSEKMTDTEQFFRVLVSPTSQSSAVPQIKLQIAAARGGQSDIDLSAMVGLLNSWNSGRQAVTAAKPDALESAGALSLVVPRLVSAASSEISAISQVASSIGREGGTLCADISAQRQTCTVSKEQVVEFESEMADLSAQENFWDQAGKATIVLAGILSVFTALDMLSKLYDYIQETRGISKSTEHDPSARDIVRTKFELFARSRWVLNRGWDRAKEYVSPSAISERWLSATRRVEEDTPRTNLRIIYDYLRACIPRAGGD